MPPDEPMGKNPPDGAILDYYLAKSASGPVTLEILDATGKVVRRYSSEDKPPMSEEQLAKQLIPLYWVRKWKALSTEAGMHRWVWDLHYETPQSTSHQYPISAVPHDTPRGPLGPRALPGKYTVRLSVNGEKLTEPLTVKMDPRVKTPFVGLRLQFNTATNLASMMSRSAVAVGEAKSVDEQLEKLSSQVSGEIKNSVAALAEKVGVLLGKTKDRPAGSGPAITTVDGEVNELYGAIDRADVAPTPAQLKAVGHVGEELTEALKKWEAIKSADLPVLNQKLKGANLPEIRPEPKISLEESHNEE